MGGRTPGKKNLKTKLIRDMKMYESKLPEYPAYKYIRQLILGMLSDPVYVVYDALIYHCDTTGEPMTVREVSHATGIPVAKAAMRVRRLWKDYALLEKIERPFGKGNERFAYYPKELKDG